MKNILKSLILVCALLAVVTAPASAQTALTATKLNSAVYSGTQWLTLASGTGYAPGDLALIDKEIVEFEPVAVIPPATSGVTRVYVRRGANSTVAVAHASGTGVLFGPPAAFITVGVNLPLAGSCTNGQGTFLYSPVVDTRTGRQYLCSTVTGTVIPGFGNTAVAAGVNTAVASPAGLATPTGPLFHITGTNAITGFTIPVGFDPGAGGGFCVIPDGAFSTTNANNIAIASTGVVSKTLCWTYDPNTAKFYPSY
jgi:hypothetical protein